MLTHKGTQALRTERLILRRFTTDDAKGMFENWASDERVTKFLTWQPHKSADETVELLKNWVDSYESLTTYNWLIEFEGKAIGNISVVRISERSENADLGYCMGVNYWNKGLMTEAAKAVIEYLFEEVGMHKIRIKHAVKNPASGRVAQKCGLAYEGTERESFKAENGEFLDIASYAILKQEWQKNTIKP